ncbi:MAG TPA: hypothetical protein VGB90_06785 [Alphaproteobacteria bacterium]
MFDGISTGPALIFPERWRTQPFEPVEIDWHHPLARDLRFCVVFNQGAGKPIDLVRRRKAVTVGSTVAGWRAGPGGLTQAWTAANADYYERDSFLEPSATPGVTVLARLRRTGTIGAWARPFNKTNNDGGASPYQSYGFNYNPESAGQTRIIAYYNINGTGMSVPSLGNAIDVQTDVEHTVIQTITGLEAWLYYNMAGVSVSHSAGDITYGTTSTGRLIVNSRSSTGVVQPGLFDIYWCAVWGRVLSASERWLAVHEPYALFRPVRPRTFFFVSEGGEPPPAPSLFERGFGRGVLRGIGGGL